MEEKKRKSFMSYQQPYFFTASINKWYKLLANDHYKQIIISAMKELAERKTVKIYAFVIMPNHIHIIWELLAPNGKEKPNTSLLKFTAHTFEKDLQTHHPRILPYFGTEKSDRNFLFWQRDPLAVHLYDQRICEQKLDYIHLNPLQSHWNLAKTPAEYFWSSARFYECGIDDFGFMTHYRDRF